MDECPFGDGHSSLCLGTFQIKLETWGLVWKLPGYEGSKEPKFCGPARGSLFVTSSHSKCPSHAPAYDAPDTVRAVLTALGGGDRSQPRPGRVGA